MSDGELQLIGLTGYGGAGKDTVADALEPHGWQRYALAGPLKAALTEMLDLPPEAFTDRQIKESVVAGIGASPRYLAQTLGTEWGRRQVAADLWVRVMRRKLLPVLARGGRVVVTDVRFDNEARAIHSMGGRMLRVRRPAVDELMARRQRRTGWRRALWRLGVPIDPIVHPSDMGVSRELVDGELVNDGSIEGLLPVALEAVRGLPVGAPSPLVPVYYAGRAA